MSTGYITGAHDQQPKLACPHLQLCPALTPIHVSPVTHGILRLAFLNTLPKNVVEKVENGDDIEHNEIKARILMQNGLSFSC